ncbi:MAG: glycosyltransferase [Phycisphaerae bacterium]|nr:glycosyltransferase [Phycisphaerae bacterium]
MKPASHHVPSAGRLRNEPALVSIVVPVFNESPNLAPLLEAISKAMETRTYELILVDDGSTDGTEELIAARAGEDERIAGLCLSRNFGHQYALAAGLQYASGDVVVMMDGDLQHPPDLIPVMIDLWRDGYTIVQARRVDTEGISPRRRWIGKLYYRLFRFLCGISLEEGESDFRLLDRTVVEEINTIREGQLFLRGLIAWMGYRRATVDYTAPPRHAGRSKYNLRKMLRLARDGILSFSSAPMRLGIVVGLGMSMLSFLEFFYVLIAKAFGATVPGWASTMALLSLVFGVIFLLLGLQGEYLIRIYERVQRRPAFLVERVIGRSAVAKDENKRTPPTSKDDDNPMRGKVLT